MISGAPHHMVRGAVIFMPEYGESGKFRGFGLEALVGEFSYGAKLVVVGIPEEGHDSGVVGGFSIRATRFLQSFPAFVCDDESGASDPMLITCCGKAESMPMYSPGWKNNSWVPNWEFPCGC